MAIVEYGSGVASFKGSISGVTFQSNGAGNIARKRPIQKKHQTNRQTLQHGYLAEGVAGWQYLTLIEQNNWNTFAGLHDKVNMWGDTRVINGFNWFFMLQRNAQLMSDTPLSAPPSYLLPSSLPLYELNISCCAVNLAYVSGLTDFFTGMLVYTSGLLSKTTAPFRNSFRFTKYISSPTPVDFDITTEWETAHNMNYPPSIGFHNYSMQALLVPIHKSTFIDVEGYTLTDRLIYCDEAIPDMAIGCSFIVR